MQTITVKTSEKRQVIDITEQVQAALTSPNGIAHVFVAHTTAAVTTADLDPGTDLDLLDFLKAITPDIRWRHPHNPAHAPAHLLSSVIGPAITVPVVGGKLQVGSWQRVILIELDGPRDRTVHVTTLTSRET